MMAEAGATSFNRLTLDLLMVIEKTSMTRSSPCYCLGLKFLLAGVSVLVMSCDVLTTLCRALAYRREWIFFGAFLE